MAKKRLDLIPGQKYKGYGFINEFGEFEFTPEQTGSRKGVKKFIKTGEGFTVCETRDLLITHITVRKTPKKVELMKEYLNIFNKTLEIIRDYEI